MYKHNITGLKIDAAFQQVMDSIGPFKFSILIEGVPNIDINALSDYAELVEQGLSSEVQIATADPNTFLPALATMAISGITGNGRFELFIKSIPHHSNGIEFTEYDIYNAVRRVLSDLETVGWPVILEQDIDVCRQPGVYQQRPTSCKPHICEWRLQGKRFYSNQLG